MIHYKNMIIYHYLLERNGNSLVIYFQSNNMNSQRKRVKNIFTFKKIIFKSIYYAFCLAHFMYAN